MTDIIVLDDDPQILKMASHMLKKEGFSAHVVEEGQLAIDFIQQKRPRLLITDILMPGMDGVEVIDQCRKQNPELKILAMSGGRRKITPEFNLKSAEMIGADATLAKPFNKQEFITTVKSLLN